MANLLEEDPRFGLQGNQTFKTGLNTLDELLNPATNRVSILPRLQQERDILTAGQSKKDAFKGDFASAGLTRSRALGAVEEALGASEDTQIAQAGFQEAQRQEKQDRLAIDAFLGLVLNPNITGQILNQQEAQLQLQLKSLRSSRRRNSLFGTLKILGGIALIATGAGAAAGVGLIAGGAGDVGG